MNHPKREEWVPYLYGEARPDARRHLKAHLKVCAECRDEIQSWNRSLKQLDAWKVPSLRKPIELFAPFLRLAAAAVVILSIGFAAGRFVGLRASADTVRAAVEPELRKEMAQLVQDEVKRASAATLTAANEQADKISAAYSQALWFSLKKDVDTVAVHVDAGLRDTRQRLIRLIDYKEPNGSSEIPGALLHDQPEQQAN
jgi:hypothetical protein